MRCWPETENRLPGSGVLVATVAAAALWGLAAAIPALGQQPQATAQDPHARLKAERRKLDETEKRASGLQADVSQMDLDRARLNQELQEAARSVQRIEGQLTSIEARRDELEAQQKLIQGSLNQRHGTIAALLSAMQRMGRNPPPVMITRREDALQMVRSAMLLARAFPELRSQAQELTGRLNELVRVMTSISAERDKLAKETERLKETQTRLAALMEVKRLSVAERQHELDDVRKAAAEISRNVTDLSQLISALDKAVADRTGLGAYDKEARAQTAPEGGAPPAKEAAPKLEPAPDPKGDGRQRVAAALPRLSNPTVELAPAGGPMAGSPGRMKPAVAFHLARGQLPLPAQGRKVLSFGEKTQSGATSKGLVVETRYDARITSPCDGWIVYAGEFRSYGQLLIINAGGGYHVLLAGLSQIDVQHSQFVLASEPVGTMSAAPKGKTQDNAPVLYVEFRKEGQPIDPEPWWVAGS
jgi:septal ring factor EnvC (AmiA/AmiB activator)